MTTVHLVVLAGFVAVLALALTSRSRPRRGAPSSRRSEPSDPPVRLGSSQRDQPDPGGALFCSRRPIADRC
jgi:hypothetical protein